MFFGVSVLACASSAAEPERFRVLDAGAAPEAVLAAALAALADVGR